MLYRVAADFILLTHVAFMLFIVLGLALIYLGSARDWPWVRNFWFRLGHLLAITVVMVQAWLGKICPLTTLEMALRSRAGETTYPGAFIAHWLETLLYFEAPVWAFALCYTIFGIKYAAIIPVPANAAFAQGSSAACHAHRQRAQQLLVLRD